MSILNNSLLLGADAGGGAGYQISRSLRFNSSDSAYLSRTPASAGNRKTWTWAGWVKLSALTGTNSSGGGTLFHCRNGTGDDGITDFLINTDGTVVFTGGASTWLTTTQVLRDFSAWYHLVISVDTTAATASNRLRLYINGSQVTTFNVNVSPSQNFDLAINQAATHRIGGRPSFSQFFNGYLADIHFIDGQALTPSSFAETNATTGQWVPKAYTGSYGTNGFRLDFSDNSAATATTLGKDRAGSNNWTPNNLSVTAGTGNDSLVDTPTSYGTDTGAGGEVRGNYCTVNPLQSVAAAVLSNGNLDGRVNSFSPQTMIGSIFQSTGKWYAECTVTLSSDGLGHIIGIVGPDFKVAAGEYVGNNAASYSYKYDGQKFNNASGVSYGSSYGLNDVIGIAMDLDGGTLTFYKNGVSQGQAYSGLTGLKAFAASLGGDSPAYECVWNFGQRPFAYTAPSGFKALTTANLPTPLIANGANAMDVKLYTGNGSTQTISGLNFSPDLVWIKGRSGATDHALYDTVRGVQQQLECNTTTDETTESTGLTAFNSDGFALGALAQANTSSATYAAWCWNESVSAGFDIVTYTGNGSARTIAHGLGVAPSMIIVKARTTASTDQGWPVYHSANTAAPETDYLLLNSTAATADLDTVWNDTAPTSSVFSVGTNALVNANADTYVAYCFAPVAGYSSFGSYTGSGDTYNPPSPFVYLGFRPAVVMVKMSSSTGNWTILDDKRKGYNVDNDPLYPNLANAEGTTDLIDITSNGFKVRTTDATFNTSAGTYVYAAWASSPFAYSRAR
jgi:hypothetical protein